MFGRGFFGRMDFIKRAFTGKPEEDQENGEKVSLWRRLLGRKPFRPDRALPPPPEATSEDTQKTANDTDLPAVTNAHELADRTEKAVTDDRRLTASPRTQELTDAIPLPDATPADSRDEVSDAALLNAIREKEYKRGLPADYAFLKAAQQELSRRKVDDSQSLNDL